MMLEQLTVARAALALFLTFASSVGVLLAVARWVVQPRVETMIREIFDAEFTERERQREPLAAAEARALTELLGRISGVEERMGRLEEAHGKAESAVERIESQGRRQTAILEAITEQLADLSVTNARMDERQKAMQERLDELQHRPARRRT